MNKHTPTTDKLHALFKNVHTVVIKEGGVHDNSAMGNEVRLTLSLPEKIARLSSLLNIEEPKERFYCMCAGDYAIELYSDHLLPETIGFHHEYSIRYYQWNSDAILLTRKELLHFLSEEGFSDPLEKYLKNEAESTIERIRERDWFWEAPKSFSRHLSEIKDFSTEYLPVLMEDLTVEIPDTQQRIIALLQLYGRSKQLWSGYPSYENVPAELLQTFDFSAIIQAYEYSDKNYKTRRGLGRFLCSFEFKKQRKKYLALISPNLTEELLKCFLAIGDEHGVMEIRKLATAIK
ncbi:hypothetical protein [Chitinophaga arvensicola]|uniref:Uncharacterized protein n=1 Tax=Chitinophaga arvensicola TaxID=29529 RepID=A0A1I0S4X9_9BACT|nr:hypothetical protein [Chitinophaga arvensicola]SEW49845.1 hypothetical protein SAMN04488122_3607 [Chitinophaga arvensicola]